MNKKSSVWTAHAVPIYAEFYNRSYERRNKNMVSASTETYSDTRSDGEPGTSSSPLFCLTTVCPEESDPTLRGDRLSAHLKISPWIELLSSNGSRCESSRGDFLWVDKWSCGRGRLISEEVFETDEEPSQSIGQYECKLQFTSRLIPDIDPPGRSDEEPWKKKDSPLCGHGIDA